MNVAACRTMRLPSGAFPCSLKFRVGVIYRLLRPHPLVVDPKHRIFWGSTTRIDPRSVTVTVLGMVRVPWNSQSRFVRDTVAVTFRVDGVVSG